MQISYASLCRCYVCFVSVDVFRFFFLSCCFAWAMKSAWRTKKRNSGFKKPTANEHSIRNKDMKHPNDFNAMKITFRKIFNCKTRQCHIHHFLSSFAGWCVTYLALSLCRQHLATHKNNNHFCRSDRSKNNTRTNTQCVCGYFIF